MSKALFSLERSFRSFKLRDVLPRPETIEAEQEIQMGHTVSAPKQFSDIDIHKQLIYDGYEDVVVQEGAYDRPGHREKDVATASKKEYRRNQSRHRDKAVPKEPITSSIYDVYLNPCRSYLKTLSQIVADGRTRYYITVTIQDNGTDAIQASTFAPSGKIVRSHIFPNVYFVKSTEENEEIQMADVCLVRKLAEEYNAVPRSLFRTFESFMMELTKRRDGTLNKFVQRIFVLLDILGDAKEMGQQGQSYFIVVDECMESLYKE